MASFGSLLQACAGLKHECAGGGRHTLGRQAACPVSFFSHSRLQAGKASCIDALADTANPCAASTCKSQKKKCVLQVGARPQLIMCSAAAFPPAWRGQGEACAA